MDNKKNANYSIQIVSVLMSGLLDSNQRPRAPQTCALPTALNPDPLLIKADAKLRSFFELANKFR